MKPLTLGELEELCKNVKFFRGVFMRDMLPENVYKNECGILNLDSFDGNGTHWVCYYKKGNIKYYFDSYGKIIDKPPKELVKYLGKENLFYNDSQIQYADDPPICGYLCVYIIKELDNKFDFRNALNKLILNKYEFSKYF